MAKLRSKQSRKQKAREKQRQAQLKFDKRLGIILGICAVIVCLGAAGVFLYRQSQLAKIDITLEELCEGGAAIYDANGDLYATLEIQKAAGWLETEDVPEQLQGMAEKCGKSYGLLIMEQFGEVIQARQEDEKTIDLALYAETLERKYSQAELQTFFLNTVYLGDGVYGVQSVAKRFFGRAYETLSEEYVEALGEKVVRYLENSRNGDGSGSTSGGDGTKTSSDAANSNMTNYEGSMIYEENGYLDGVVKETAQKLMDTGMDERSAYNMVFFGGLSIYTYLDTEVQKTLDEAYADKHTFTIVEKEYDYVQSAMVIMDHEGHIKAVASGNDGDKVFNRALSQRYQVGSTIKPVSTYSLGIEHGLIHFSSLVPNQQTMITSASGEEYLWPSNSDGEYGGEVIVTKALQESKNTVAVEIGRMVGEQTMYEFLQGTMDFDLVYYQNGESDAQLSALTLGYLYNGETLAKMTSAYEIFAAKGQYYNSNIVQKVVSSKEDVMIENQTQPVQALTEETAYILNRLLYNNVNGEYGIAKAAQIEDVEVLGKTGTVGNDNGQSASRMFIGITGDYIAGVWMGYDDERALSLQSYYNPDEIFLNIMARLAHSGVKFEKPEGVVEHDYCEHTGMLATEHCQKVSKGFYTEDNIPEYCDSCGDNN